MVTAHAGAGDPAAASVPPLLAALAGRLPADPAAALGLLRRHRLSPAVLDGLSTDLPGGLAADPTWRAAVERDRERAQRIERARELVEAALADVKDVAVAGDSLGPLWSSDVDLYAAPQALPAVAAALERAGCVALDPLLGRLRRGRGRVPRSLHIAAVEDGAVLAQVEVSTRLWDGGPDASAAVRRAVPGDGLPRLAPGDAARRRLGKLAAARRATARGALELTALLERGEARPGAQVLARHAELERELMGPGPLTAAESARRPGVDLAWWRARASAVRHRALRPARSTQLRVAFCGIDGAGKSTQARTLEQNLGRAGVPAVASWTRIGNGASAPVMAVAKLAQRILPRGSHSFQTTRMEAGRQAPADAPPKPVTAPLTRRGVLGWSWATAVTVDYLCRQHAARLRAGSCVLVLDRALPDALVELQDDYGIVLRLRFQRRLLERFAVVPHRTFYLRLSGTAAKRRKDDMFTAAELDAHIALYDELLAEMPGVAIIDAEKPREAIAVEVLRTLAAP